jgi:hypothetical protein
MKYQITLTKKQLAMIQRALSSQVDQKLDRAGKVSDGALSVLLEADADRIAELGIYLQQTKKEIK